MSLVDGPSPIGGSSSHSQYGSLGAHEGRIPRQQSTSSGPALDRSPSSSSNTLPGAPYSTARRVSHPAVSFSRTSSMMEKDGDAGSGSDTPPADSNSISFFNMSRQKKFTVVTFCLGNFFVGAFYSLLGPFFPNEVQCNIFIALNFLSRKNIN